MKQIEKTHYDFQKYMNLARWSCYYLQIKKTLALKPASVLEIGPGDGLYGNYLKRNGIAYSSVDHADDILSDYKAELGYEKIPVADKSYDVVSAFQVLEHIPFDLFEESLKELKRVSKRYVFLDIPQYAFHIKFCLKLPLLPYIQILFLVPRPVVHHFDGFHHWEIGKRGFSPKKVRTVIEKQFKIIEEFSPFTNPKERFFLLEVE